MSTVWWNFAHFIIYIRNLSSITAVLEFDSRHGDIPKNTSGADSTAGGAFPWERRRRAGSYGSIDTENGLFDGFGGSNAPVGEHKLGFDLHEGELKSVEPLFVVCILCVLEGC